MVRKKGSERKAKPTTRSLKLIKQAKGGELLDVGKFRGPHQKEVAKAYNRGVRQADIKKRGMGKGY